MEYDVPEDVITKNIGFGDYTKDTWSTTPRIFLEAFVEKNDFGKNIVNSDEVSENEKRINLLNSFKETLNRIRIEEYLAFDDIEYYDENDADISYSAEDMIKKLSGSN